MHGGACRRGCFMLTRLSWGACSPLPPLLSSVLIFPLLSYHTFLEMGGGGEGIGEWGEWENFSRFINIYICFEDLQAWKFSSLKFQHMISFLAVFKWPVRAYKFDYFCHQCQTVSFRGSVLKPGLIEFHIGRFNNQFLDDITLHISALIPSCSWLVGGELINAPTESPNSSGD